MQSTFDIPSYKTDFWMIFYKIDHCVLLRSYKKCNLYLNMETKDLISKVAIVVWWSVSLACVLEVPSLHPGRT